MNQRLGVIKRVKYLLPLHARLTLYNSLILPLFDYGDIVWGDKNNSWSTYMYLVETTESPMKTIWRFIHWYVVCLAIDVKLTVCDSVTHSSDCTTKVRYIVVVITWKGIKHAVVIGPTPDLLVLRLDPTLENTCALSLFWTFQFDIFQPFLSIAQTLEVWHSAVFQWW